MLSGNRLLTRTALIGAATVTERLPRIARNVAARELVLQILEEFMSERSKERVARDPNERAFQTILEVASQAQKRHPPDAVAVGRRVGLKSVAARAAGQQWLDLLQEKIGQLESDSAACSASDTLD